ncbi:MAG: amidase [Chloroflexi bacterium]|nr:amidase [Chloroflexota bacterium]
MSNESLAFAPAWRLRDMVAAKQVSPVELTQLFLDRIEKLNPVLNAYLTVAGDQALDAARQAERAVLEGKPLGPLHGLPIALKDLNSTRGIRTTHGSLLYKDFVPQTDDIVVARIRDAGAIILGKTNTPEFGHSGTTENLLGDDCRNPWDIACTSGGSSGGAASGLAAAMHPLAQGSDGGGSIRIPAGMCGVFGLKPTQGRVPRRYTGPGGWNVFGQDGTMTRTVRDAALLLQVMAGPHQEDPTAIAGGPPDFCAGLSQGVKGMRFGLCLDIEGVPVDPAVRAAVRQAALAFEEMGASVEETTMPFDHETARRAFMTIFLADYAASLGEVYRRHKESFSPLMARFMEEAIAMPASALAGALRGLEWHRNRMDCLMRRFDLLLTPTLATTAFPIRQRPAVIDGCAVDPDWGFTPFAFLFNMSGHPAASVPCGFSPAGLPIGLQVAGHRGAEATVLRAAASFEEARPWADKRPQVC